MLSVIPDAHLVNKTNKPDMVIGRMAIDFEDIYGAPLLVQPSNEKWVISCDAGLILEFICKNNDYPCKILFDGAISKNLRTEAEFIGELARVFHSQKVKLMLRSLISNIMTERQFLSELSIILRERREATK